jgi:hypothetical protein
MGGFVSGVAMRGCRATRTWMAATLALVALALAFAGTAAAQPAATLLGLTGMTAPAGVAVTPDGEIWISDEAMGLCRVTESGLVEDEFCAPEPAVPPTTPTRPAGTGQIAFDPATNDFYVAEGTSGGSGIWRMHWDGGKVVSATKIFESTGVARIQGLALTATGAVVFSDKETTFIRRLNDPAAIDTPVAAADATVGHSINGGVASIAVLGDRVYLADGGQVTVIDSGAIFPSAVPVSGQGIAAGVSAVAADPARGVVYAGTATPDLTDEVLSIVGDQLSPTAYDRGYTNVTAMALGADGALLVATDPNGALSPSEDPFGHAQLWRKAKGPLVAPQARLLTKPNAAQQSGAVTFTFDALNGTDATTFACTLDAQAVACPASGPAAGAYATPAGEELGEGPHTFSVRAANVPDATADDWGPAATYAFTVDRTAPSVTIDEPTAKTAPGGALRLYFSADSAGVAFTCQVDDAAPAPCDAPADLTLTEGEHAIAVRATDAAGNESAPAIWLATTTPAPVVTNPAPATGTPRTGGRPAPAASITSQATPALTDAPRAAPRIEIGVPCVEVSPARAAASMRLEGRQAVVRFRAPAQARYAKVTLRRTARTARAAGAVETLAYARVTRAGATHLVHVALTRGERRLVRAGGARLAIAYGTCRTQVGAWQWIPTAR